MNLLDYMNKPASARTSHPGTSHVAAKHTTNTAKMMEVVREIMADGIPRIDDEIIKAGRDQGQDYGDSSYRRGRKALLDAGELRKIGTRKTEHGCPAREWVKA